MSAFATLVVAQKSCSNTLAPATGAPILAKGFTSRVLVNGITKARGIVFDSEGNLLVVSGGRGIIGMQLKDDGGDCVSVAKSVSVVIDSSVGLYPPWVSPPQKTKADLA